MPLYLQILSLLVAFIVFVFTAMYLTGLGLRRVCFKIITEMEEARAFNEKKAMKIQDQRQNFFLVGVKNIRPKALNVLLADKLVIKTADGRYYLDKEKLAEARLSINK